MAKWSRSSNEFDYQWYFFGSSRFRHARNARIARRYTRVWHWSCLSYRSHHRSLACRQPSDVILLHALQFLQLTRRAWAFVFVSLCGKLSQIIWWIDGCDCASRNSPMASGTTLSGYKSVRKRELTSVDFPNPDSPTIISVNSKPFFTDLRCTWFGKLAKPT